MTIQTFVKGLLMALISIAVTAFSTTPVDYAVLIITVISTILVYSGKNLIYIFDSETPAGKLSWINLTSGVIVAIGTGLIQSMSMFILDGAIEWLVVGNVSLSILFTYLGTTFFSGPQSLSRKFI